MPNNFHHKLIDLLKLVREPLCQSKNARKCSRELQSNRPIRKLPRNTRTLLADLLDNNRLYVRFTEIDDQNLNVSLEKQGDNPGPCDVRATHTFSK